MKKYARHITIFTAIILLCLASLSFAEVPSEMSFVEKVINKIEKLKTPSPDGTFPWKMVIFISTGICGLLLIILGILWIVFLNEIIKTKTRHIQIITGKMMEKDKLAILGKLAGQIAHELRTPLSILHNSVYLLRKEGSENRELFEKRLELLEGKIKLCSNILESMLSYSRIKAEIAQTISLKDCLNEVTRDIEIPPGIKINISFENEDMLVVFMDYYQLYSVLRNLTLNSVQAMGDEGELEIRAFLSDDNKKVTIRICDTGLGIIEGARNKIFNLFYSSKITGTGLGLPISKSIIEANNGSLYLSNTGPKGSCFVIILNAFVKKMRDKNDG